jgi:ribosomal protein L16
MLMPKKVKYRKVQKGRVKGRSKGARSVAFGDYGLVAVDPGRITARQIEAVRVALSRRLKKIGKYFTPWPLRGIRGIAYATHWRMGQPRALTVHRRR